MKRVAALAPALALLVAAAPSPQAAAPSPANRIKALPAGAPAAPVSATSWGVLDEIARREWTTEKEPRPRISKFRWIEQGRVLEARHGFVSRLQFGEAKFADTVQRFVLNEKTGAIDVTYSYEDGRPPLKTVIRIEPDGTAIESFTDAAGVKKRNIHKSPRLSLNVIERQEMRDTAWASLGTTRKAGLTREEIAENARRAEEARQLAIAEERAREAARQAQLAAEQAQRDAEQAAYEADQQANQQMAQNMPNMLDVLNNLGASIQRENQQRQAQFDRQMRQAVQEEARRKAEAARAESERIAAENSRRVQEANARQAAIAQQYAQRQADSQAQASANAAQAEAERARRVEAQRRQAEADQARRVEEQRQAADAERQRREAQAAEAERQRQADARAREQARLLAERNAPVDWPESVTLCAKDDDQARFGNYRCVGSLQMNYVNFEKPNWPSALNMTCGGPFNKRDLGMVNGYRAFGCGFGLRQSSPDDVPRRYGISYVPGRITFRCPRSASSCTSR